MNPVVVKDLVKHYRKGAKALGGVSLELREGETFGLLGPNGAGKTTFVKCILGLAKPTSGGIAVFGRDTSNPASRAVVGFAPEVPKFPDYLTAKEVMAFHARLARVPKEQARQQSETLLEEAELTEQKKRVRSFSKGMVRRLALAQAYLGDPKLVVLDEPTADLDPIGRRDVRNKLIRLKQQGVAILLNSHLLSEVERVCDRVAIMHKGEILAIGTLDELVPEGTDLETVFVELIESRR